MDFARRSEAASPPRELTCLGRINSGCGNRPNDYLDAIEFAERQRLLTWMERLAEHPSRTGDFTERGSDGRAWQVAVVAAHAVVWWVDDAVCEVKVVVVRPADT